MLLQQYKSLSISIQACLHGHHMTLIIFSIFWHAISGQLICNWLIFSSKIQKTLCALHTVQQEGQNMLLHSNPFFAPLAPHRHRGTGCHNHRKPPTSLSSSDSTSFANSLCLIEKKTRRYCQCIYHVYKCVRVCKLAIHITSYIAAHCQGLIHTEGREGHHPYIWFHP